MKNILKKYWYVSIIIICIALLYLTTKEDEKDIIVSDNIKEEIIKEEVEDENISYYVDIKGEVITPGVYEVSSNSRIIDVIKIAGGLTKNADTSLLNLSKKVTDEMNIKIYSKNEVKTAKESLTKEPEVIEIIKEIEKECVCPDKSDVCSDNKNDALIEDNTNNNIENNSNIENTTLININTATKEELLNIPNIGDAKAENIIEYRSKNKFSKIEDILNVSGIGEAVFEKIKNYITV